MRSLKEAEKPVATISPNASQRALKRVAFVAERRS
jgi:hypothetical protein